MVSDLRVFSPQCGLCRKLHSSFTAESLMLFLLRSSSVRWEGLDFRAEPREAQLISDKLQSLNLNKELNMWAEANRMQVKTFKVNKWKRALINVNDNPAASIKTEWLQLLNSASSTSGSIHTNSCNQTSLKSRQKQNLLLWLVVFEYFSQSKHYRAL